MELLAHVSAASSKRDDDRYKRQARAYSGFGVANTVPISHSISANSQRALSVQPDENHVLAETSELPEQSPCLFLDDTQLARTALESQLITSSLQHEPDTRTSAADLSSGDLASTGNDPLSPCILSNLSKKKHISLKRSRSLSTTQSPHRSWPSVSPSRGPASEGDGLARGYTGRKLFPNASLSTPSKRPAIASLLGQRLSSSPSDDIPSQLPSTYSLSDVASRSSRQHEDGPGYHHSHHAFSTPTRNFKVSGADVPLPARSPLLDSLKRTTRLPGSGSSPVGRDTHGKDRTSLPVHDLANPSPPPAIAIDRDRCVPLPPTQCNEALPNLPGGRASFDEKGNTAVEQNEQIEPEATGPPPQRPVTKTSVSGPITPMKPGECAILQTLTMVISPGPPPTSSEKFVSHVTPDLEKLYTNPDLSKCYRPKRIVRPLRQSERGHWAVDPSMWSTSLQIAFWKFLEKQIGGQKAGWGVWCTRDLDSRVGGDDFAGLQSSNHCLGQVKIFCWGEIVQHVYMMLFVASKSKIKRGSSVWIDAGEEVIIQM